MKKIMVLFLCFASLLLGAVPAAPKKEVKTPKVAKKKAPKPELTVVCTPASHIAKEGEKVEFKITSTTQDPITVTISLDGSSEKVFKKVTMKSPVVLSASLSTPGFLHCDARSRGVVARYGVAVAPEKIRYARKAPADFKKFWESALAESKRLPLDLQIKAINPDKGYDSYVLSCANVNGKRAYALYACPKNVKGKVPLQVMFGGGEAYYSKAIVPGGAKSAKSRFKQDMAVLFLHLPPYEPQDTWSKAREFHKEFLKKLGLRRYILAGMDDPKKFYGYSAILGCLRLLESVAKRPEIDREKIVFHGASHGGMFGAYLSYFFPFKAAFIGVPSNCEINAFLEGRYGSTVREWKKYWKNTEYYELVYFAPGIKCPVMVGVGFSDRSCPPTGVYSFYNALPEGKKRIFNKIHHGHGGGPKEYSPATWKFLADHIAPQAKK